MGVGQLLKYRTSRKSLSQPDSNPFLENEVRSGAPGRTRTDTPVRIPDFESVKIHNFSLKAQFTIYTDADREIKMITSYFNAFRGENFQSTQIYSFLSCPLRF